MGLCPPSCSLRVYARREVSVDTEDVMPARICSWETDHVSAD